MAALVNRSGRPDWSIDQDWAGYSPAEHGIYEWHVLEPTLNRLITPLLFSFAGDGGRETLAGLLDPEDVYPNESLHARLA